MPLYVISFIDKPDTQQQRLEARQDHLDYVRASGVLKLAGPYIDGAGEMIGSLLIIEAEDEAAARAFSDNDPYRIAGVFDRAEVRAWRHTVGRLP